MTDNHAERPLSLAGTFTFEGGTGCWLTDRLGLLDDDFVGEPYTLTDIAWRHDTTVGAVSVGHDFDLAAAVGHLEQGERVPGVDRDLPSFLRHLEYAAGITRDASELSVFATAHLSAHGDGEARIATFAADLAVAVRAIDPFLAILDSEAVSACHRDGGPRDDVEYAGFDRTLHPERALAVATEAMPLLRDTLAAMYAVDHAAFTDAAVGRGRPLRDVVRAYLARDGGKRVADVALRVLGIVEGLDGPTRAGIEASLRHRSDLPVQVARDLSSLPASWMPRTTAAFLDFAACLPAVRAAVSGAAEGRAGDMLNAMGDWAGYRRRLAKACGVPASIGADALGRAVRDVDDMADSFARQVVAPAMARAAEAPAGADPRVSVGRVHVPWHMALRMIAKSLIQEGRTLPATLEASRRWHGARWRLLQDLPGRENLPDGWLAGMPAHGHGDVDIVPVTDAEGLEAEGATGADRDGMTSLSHCVGGHAGACLAGTSRIVSLRTRRGGRTMRLSTAEYRLGRDGPERVQHRGNANGAPPEEAEAALEAYEAGIRAGRLPFDRDAWQPVEGGDPITLAADYDWRTDGHLEAALEAWKPFLPRSLRGVTPGELASRVSEGGAFGRHGWRKDTTG